MKKKSFQYIYGPVASWRLGASLGIDLFPAKGKVCTFDCVYCQLGGILKYTKRPKVYVLPEEIIRELNQLPEVKIDYITFSGRGEPGLAANIDKIIKAVKALNIAPVAVLTNSSLLSEASVRKQLACADFVIAKLDAYSQDSLNRINKPARSIKFKQIIQGIKKFKQKFKGRLALQIMFVDQNKEAAKKLMELAREIGVEEIQLNTPLRPSKARPLSKSQMENIKKCFAGLDCICVYDLEPKRVSPISKAQTLKRRGKICV